MAISMLKAVLSLTWELPYLVRPSFLLRRPPGVHRRHIVCTRWLILQWRQWTTRNFNLSASLLLLSSLFRLTSKETPMLRITGPLWGESTGFIKGQYIGKCFTSWRHISHRWKCVENIHQLNTFNQLTVLVNIHPRLSYKCIKTT